MKPVYLKGVGLWTSHCTSAADWSRGKREASEVSRAAASLLEGPLKRRASKLTRMSVDAFEQAVAQAGSDPSSIPTIWATAHGEHGTAIALLKMMRRGEGKVSPTHFHNSVHNTPSAYASISAGNGAGSTTLTGGPELVASALLEAFCQLHAGQNEIAVVVADEPLQGPFVREDMPAPLAIAFVFSSSERGAVAQLDHLRLEANRGATPLADFGGLYVSAGIGLLEASVDPSATQTIPLELPERGAEGIERLRWALDLSPVA